MSYFGRFLKILLLILSLGMVASTHAVQQIESAEQVFQITSKQIDAKTLAVHWTIKPGYYLYRNKIHFHSDQAAIRSAVFPKGILKQNQFLGKYQVYQHDVTVLLKFATLLQDTFTLTINYQGCAANFCYPPVTQVLSLQPHKEKLTVSCKEELGRTAGQNLAQTKSSHAINEQGEAVQLLTSHNLWLILLGFFGFGLLLSLTPCVLPLIPILSAIILGQKQLTTLKAFILSLIYVLSMALTYAMAGVFAGLAGSYLQAFLQNPLVIVLVSLIFILLAFSLFGFYELRLPTSWQATLANISNRQRGGNYLGVALMGCLSTLVISPCVTAPLVGVLAYIGNSGNAVLGGFALFILGLGSGVPLLIIGTSEGKWLPKSGSWMYWVKIMLGIIMIVMAAWLLSRIIPADSQFFHWSQSNQVTPPNSSHFQTIEGIPDFTRALANAKQTNKPVMVDFYADWCLSCKEMERLVFSAPQVKSLLSQFIVLRADVTANNAVSKALENKFKVIAPPTFLFFTPDGRELTEQRIIGQLASQVFANHLQGVLSSK